MSQILKQQLFANRWARALYHRGNERGIEIRTFQGMAVLKEEAKEWFKKHPVVIPYRKNCQGISQENRMTSTE